MLNFVGVMYLYRHMSATMLPVWALHKCACLQPCQWYLQDLQHTRIKEHKIMHITMLCQTTSCYTPVITVQAHMRIIHSCREFSPLFNILHILFMHVLDQWSALCHPLCRSCSAWSSTHDQSTCTASTYDTACTRLRERISMPRLLHTTTQINHLLLITIIVGTHS